MTRSGKAANQQNQQYLEVSREFGVSLTFVLPLLVGYEAGLVLTSASLENAIGLFLFKWPFEWLFGESGLLVLNGVTLLAFLIAYVKVERRGKAGGGLYFGMLLESMLYAGCIALLGMLLPDLLLGLGQLGQAHQLQPFLLAIGAGVYEELFFRLFLLGGTLWLLDRHSDIEWRWAALAAIVLSSTIFSAAHYVGPAGQREVFSAAGFGFRYLAGVLLGLIYLQRGLGIAVYTHAFYDILVVLRQLAERAA